MNPDAMKQLQEMFKKRGLNVQPPKEEKKQEIKGNAEGFANAKKLMEAKFGNKTIQEKPNYKTELTTPLSVTSQPVASFPSSLPPLPNFLPPPPPLPPKLPATLLPPPSLSTSLPPPPPPPPKAGSSPSTLILPPPPSLPPPPLPSGTPSLPKTQSKTAQSHDTKPTPPPVLNDQAKVVHKPQTVQTRTTIAHQTPAPSKIELVKQHPNHLTRETVGKTNQKATSKPSQSGIQQPQLSDIRRKIFEHPSEKIPEVQSSHQHQHQRKAIFELKPKPPARSLSRAIFGVDVSGYFKSILMSKSDVLKNVEKGNTKQLYQFIFPSVETDRRPKENKNTIFFNSDADVVPSFTPYAQSSENNYIPNNHLMSLAFSQFKSKLGVQGNKQTLVANCNWKSDDPKIMQVKLLKQKLSFIPDEDFPELDYSKVRKISRKIQNVTKKYERQQEYMKCEEYKKLNDKLKKLCDGFWTMSASEKKSIIQKIDNTDAWVTNQIKTM